MPITRNEIRIKLRYASMLLLITKTKTLSLYDVSTGNPKCQTLLAAVAAHPNENMIKDHHTESKFMAFL